MSPHFTDLTRAFRRRWSTGRAASCVPDPFETLGVQFQLARIATEIHRLECDQGRWARAHHLTAAMAAYDDLLTEAALLSGCPVPDATPAVRRVIIESELRQRGWSW